MDNSKKNTVWTIILVVTMVLALAAVSLAFKMVKEAEAAEAEVQETVGPEVHEDVTIMDSFDALYAEAQTDAKEAALSVPKVFWLSDDTTVAPEPDQACYGSTKDPTTLQWLIDEAATLLNGQELIFNTDVKIFKGSEVTYYLDDSILAICWKQVFDNYVYTMAEVKVSHPSQFRRHLVNNDYKSKALQTTQYMSIKVNAVVAASGDFYRTRKYGITVNDGVVTRFKYANTVDNCFVDENGDLILTPRGTFETKEACQSFVDENNIQFGLAFGPILVENGEQCEPAYYALGEVNQGYPRCALCQVDTLHYLVVTGNGKAPYFDSPTIHTFAKNVAALGVKTAYALDGGQTGAIVMNDKLMNPISLSKNRAISDCLFFATALTTQTGETGSE